MTNGRAPSAPAGSAVHDSGRAPVYLKIGQLLSTRADLLREDYVKALSALRCRRMCRQQPESLWIPMAALLLSSTTMSEKAVLHDIG